MYTTVKTTTHTTSTKCQYIDKTSARSACCFPTSPQKRENQHRRKSEQADRHVKCMQADKGVVSCPEQVGLDGQALVVDQVMPLAKRAQQKDRSQCDCQKPPQAEGNYSPAPQQSHGEVNRETARQQTNRQEDRNMQHIARLRVR